VVAADQVSAGVGSGMTRAYGDPVAVCSVP
jgi:hypothetical protein